MPVRPEDVGLSSERLARIDARVYQAGNHPDFATTPCERPMTIRHLLSHQSRAIIYPAIID